MVVWFYINYNIFKGKGSKILFKLVKYYYNVSISVLSRKEEM